MENLLRPPPLNPPPGAVPGCSGSSWCQAEPTPATESADLQLGPGELLVAVRALAERAALADGGSLRRTLQSGSATKRWYEPFFTGDGLDAWLLWWSCGGDIELHDHGGAAGAIYVLEGSLLETHGTRRSRRLTQRTLRAGGSIAFGPDYIHDIVNVYPEPALSLHLYGPRLESMTYYRLDDRSGTLVPDRSERMEPIPEAATMARSIG